ncbi:MAG: leucyl aminopeptidase [Ignavibacteria bacterium]|nr:leucyl aminopeptidase [Ignavibacteria bacterium]
MFEISYKSEGKGLKKSKKMAVLAFFNKEKLKNETDEFIKKHNIVIPDILMDKFLGHDEESVKAYTYSSPEIIKLVKYDVKKLNTDFFRNSVSKFIIELSSEKVSSASIFIPEDKVFLKIFNTKNNYLRSFIEGAGLGNYEFNKYKSDKKKSLKLDVVFHSGFSKDFEEAIKTSRNVLEAVYFSRDIINEPAISLTPEILAEKTMKLFKNTSVTVEVWDKKELRKNKMNAILAVGGASSNDPRLIILKYKSTKKNCPKIALVGKGVTYDSGGLSIKPTSSMLDMKIDMSGAAAVIGAIYAAAKNKLDADLIGVIPAVENMLSGSSYKPGDIIKTYSGKTIEVLDTDAEGRIILADALYYASKQNPDEIIDLATLTGACVVALGEYAAGIFTQNDQISGGLIKAGNETFERVWSFPMWDEYAELIKSDVADISNLGPRWGGAITAAKFLENFVTKPEKWVHIDLAPAGKNKLNSYSEKYHTGFGVRLLYRYIEMMQD